MSGETQFGGETGGETYGEFFGVGNFLGGESPAKKERADKPMEKVLFYFGGRGKGWD